MKGPAMAFRNMRVWQYIDEVARAGSVRQASERVNITSSALLRRLQDVEHDLGTPIFERYASGMKLTAAGELLMRWVRSQNADLQRVTSQIAELKGLQRGEVTIACSQATQSFLAQEINEFRKEHPGIKFSVTVTDPRAAMESLSTFESDLVVIFQPFMAADLQLISSIEQRLVAIMAHDHPLASRPEVRLSECGSYDVALSAHNLGGREQLEKLIFAAAGRLNVMFDTNSFAMLPSVLVGTKVVAFNIEIGALDWAQDPRLAVRRISDIKRASGPVSLGQLKGRSLPLAPAKFAEHLREAMRRLDAAQGGSGSEPVKHKRSAA